jgi:hypothetical protein
MYWFSQTNEVVLWDEKMCRRKEQNVGSRKRTRLYFGMKKYAAEKTIVISVMKQKREK